MTTTYSDTFSGSGALGVTEVGALAWQALIGTWTRSNGHAVTSQARTSNPMAVVDVGIGDVDVSANVSSTGGDALCFRVQDANNWWRLRVNQYQTSSSSTYYVTEYQWAQQYYDSNVPEGNYGSVSNPYVAYQWSTYGGPDGPEVPDFSYLNSEGYVLLNNPYKTGATRQSARTSTSYYNVNQVILEKCVAGTITTVRTYSGAATSLRVVTRGSSITPYINGTAQTAASDTTLATATMHGIGRGGSSGYDGSAIDNFAITPANTAPNPPTLVVASALNRAKVNRIGIPFSDPDVGDSQSKWDIRYRRTDVALDEIQTVTIGGAPTGGTFTLTYDGQTTTALAYNATVAQVTAALQALSTIGSGNVEVSGTDGASFSVTFTGALAATDVPQMTATSSLTGGTAPTVTVVTTRAGVPYPAWTVVSSKTPNQFWDSPANTFDVAPYEAQGQSYDAIGTPSGYGPSAFFSAADAPDAPDITQPVAGGTVTQYDEVDWSTPNADGYQVRRVADNNGAADETTVYSDTGEVDEPSTRKQALEFDVNGRWEHIQVRVIYNGLWSDWADDRVWVSWTPPPAPSVVLYPEPETASLLVVITNPAPTGDQPDTAYNDVLVDDDDGKGPIRKATQLATNTPWRYWGPRSGVEYLPNIWVTAVGTNGVTTKVAAGALVVDGGAASTTDFVTVVDGGSASTTAYAGILDGGSA